MAEWVRVPRAEDVPNATTTTNQNIRGITDRNIRPLVRLYMTRDPRLPPSLQNKHIGEWNVSQVTNMRNLFNGYVDFNEDLSMWDVRNVTNMNGMFHGCRTFNQPLDAWGEKLGNVTSMNSMFSDCRMFNQPLNAWGGNLGNVMNMGAMFHDCRTFNQPLDAWNVSNVTYMGGMFIGCDTFNQPLGAWNVSNVTNMRDMFWGCREFNQPLNAWGGKLGNVTNMRAMFWSCWEFNQPLNTWKVHNVTDMSRMFRDCSVFNQNLNTWKVHNVTDMSEMFNGCSVFNQPLQSWNVNRVTNMSRMFTGCVEFNQPINTIMMNNGTFKWNVTNVQNMEAMFEGCRNFDKPLDNWNVSSVTDMNSMFKRCVNFNQPLRNWSVHNVTDMGEMFANCTEFNQPLDSWYPSNVTNMREMFRNCISFDNNISSWEGRLRDDIDMEYMFLGCDIEEIYKPAQARYRRVRRRVEVVHEPDDENDNMRVDPLQIHDSAAKINYEKLLEFFAQRTGEVPTPSNYAAQIQTMMQQFIAESGTDGQASLESIMDLRLRRLNYREFSPLQLSTYMYALAYVNLQPTEFKRAYMEAFLQDCTQAYEGQGAAAMTCAQGALERIVTSLITAVQTMASTGNENPDWDNLVAIIVANPAKLIPQYIQDWYKMHKTGTENAFAPVTSTDMRRADLRQFLLEKFPNEATLIDQQIAAVADSIGYEDDDFMYGGRRLARLSRARPSQAVKASRKRGPGPNRKQRRRTVKRTKKPRKN